MNVQPKLWNHEPCMPMTGAASPQARAARDLPGPASVLGLPDGRVLALGDVP